MSPRISFQEAALQLARETEFDVATSNFSDLEIRAAGNLYYFYDVKSRRLIKNFVLRQGPKVDTMCEVLLIRKEDVFTPRLTFWKKDKSKGSINTLTESEVGSQSKPYFTKSRVDVSE